MKPVLVILITILGLSSCAQKRAAITKIPAAENGVAAKNEAVAYFAEGCFWHTEIVFQSLYGVRDAVSGYAGGLARSPDYDAVSTGTTGHAESVAVYYDPEKISYETLVKAFFASHDPTTLNRQGPDEGSQYRSIAFYNSPQEKNIIEREIKQLAASGIYKNRIVTEVIPLTKFYPAEDYHQEYIAHHPDNAYVRNVNIPDYLKFRREFKGRFKD
jgi:peptide-methionine (S)-S-oxide reductase